MQPTGNTADAIIIGGGPVGSYAALNLAKLGVKVTVFEEHPQIGLPSHCAGHLSIRSLRNMGLYPLPKGIVENTFSTANFYSPAGTKFSIHLSHPVTAALNRARFDQYLAGQAEAAGAQFVLNTRVQSLIMSGRFCQGRKYPAKRWKEEKVYSKITLDAEGVSSRLLRQAGLTALKPEGLVYAVEAEVENVQDVELTRLKFTLAKIMRLAFTGGLFQGLTEQQKLVWQQTGETPANSCNTLMTKHPVASKQLGKAKITQIGYHAISLGGPINRTYANGFLACRRLRFTG